ncbi:MAG: 23S rRNA (guanosine(2251)-2'-O)-methyltransferase RlmB [Proteobacteria bacterium]|nr:23S rRNA (guanosine(2251)-2'-O)-methyltransferase RlmB [Pseudomonadota bacterium]
MPNERPKRPARSFSKGAAPQPPRRSTFEAPFFICGLHPVEEALSVLGAETLERARLYIADSRQMKALGALLERAQACGLPVEQTTVQALNDHAGETRHQGVLLTLPAFRYAELDDVLSSCTHAPFIVALDQIQDPHNLGAIIRSAAAFGADAIIIPKDRAVQVTATTIKTSAGQAYRLPICRITNLAQTLRQLKEAGLQVIGADMEGLPVQQIDFRPPTVLVMGSESQGMRRLTRTLCDQTACIEHHKTVESLNVSVAAAIMLYQASLSRR